MANNITVNIKWSVSTDTISDVYEWCYDTNTYYRLFLATSRARFMTSPCEHSKTSRSIVITRVCLSVRLSAK